MSIVEPENRRARASHIWEAEQHQHYVEPPWVSRRLFEVERFEGGICDPCCGLGNILDSAALAGHSVSGFDIVDRGAGFMTAQRDFFSIREPKPNIVSNPPFDGIERFALHALSLAERKVAMVCPTRRLNAAGKWLKGTPLYRIWYVTPRPSMPPGQEYIRLWEQGKEASGGTVDFCWLVWLKGYEGEPIARWLHRDGDAA